MKEGIYKTSDFYAASVLLTRGFGLRELDRSNGKFAVFVFNDPTTKAKDCESRYWGGQIKCDPKELIRNIKELKNRIYAKV
jgi:hypothetical protein